MSDRCQRFEEEGLLRLERGEPLDGHFQQCAPCQQAAVSYGRLQATLSRLPAASPRPDWEAKVWAKLRNRRRRRTWLAAGSALASACAVLLAVVLWPGAVAAPSLDVRVAPAGHQVVRGASAKPGDVLELRGVAPGTGHAELRVYRDGQRVFRCARECLQGERLTASFPLEATGRYEAVLLLADEERSGSSPAADMNSELGAAAASGAQVITAAAVDVF